MHLRSGPVRVAYNSVTPKSRPVIKNRRMKLIECQETPQVNHCEIQAVGSDIATIDSPPTESYSTPYASAPHSCTQGSDAKISVSSCQPTNPSPSQELRAVKHQISALENKYTLMVERLGALDKKYDDLSTKFTTLTAEHAAVKAANDTLLAELQNAERLNEQLRTVQEDSTNRPSQANSDTTNGQAYSNIVRAGNQGRQCNSSSITPEQGMQAEWQYPRSRARPQQQLQEFRIPTGNRFAALSPELCSDSGQEILLIGGSLMKNQVTELKKRNAAKRTIKSAIDNTGELDKLIASLDDLTIRENTVAICNVGDADIRKTRSEALLKKLEAFITKLKTKTSNIMMTDIVPGCFEQGKPLSLTMYVNTALKKLCGKHNVKHINLITPLFDKKRLFTPNGKTLNYQGNIVLRKILEEKTLDCPSDSRTGISNMAGSISGGRQRLHSGEREARRGDAAVRADVVCGHNSASRVSRSTTVPIGSPGAVQRSGAAVAYSGTCAQVTAPEEQTSIAGERAQHSTTDETSSNGDSPGRARSNRTNQGNGETTKHTTDT